MDWPSKVVRGASSWTHPQVWAGAGGGGGGGEREGWGESASCCKGSKAEGVSRTTANHPVAAGATVSAARATQHVIYSRFLKNLARRLLRRSDKAAAATS